MVIENRDYKQIIKHQDGPNTLFYLDPPYVHDTRHDGKLAYVHEMTDEQHIELATIIHSIEGMAVLSGYHSALYDRLYKDWRKEELKTKDGVEVLWFSPNCEIKNKTLF